MRLKLIPCVFALCCCNNIHSEKNYHQNNILPVLFNEYSYKKIAEIPVPAGFFRIDKKPGSFSKWLENICLKKDKTVYTFNGTPKSNQQAQFAVLDISTGNKDLQQCADAVIRLRAEYLFEKNDFEKIIFKDYNGTEYKFQMPYSRKNFNSYLERVFGMCGSASLAKQLSSHVEIKDIIPGDILIHGGFPGHAVTVMDVAANKEGKKIYMLAQSYMPAQDIHILLNPKNRNNSPWYEVNDDAVIQTPEYNFTRFELKRW